MRYYNDNIFLSIKIKLKEFKIKTTVSVILKYWC